MTSYKKCAVMKFDDQGLFMYLEFRVSERLVCETFLFVQVNVNESPSHPNADRSQISALEAIYIV
jgi:hypothetical protein